MKKIVILISAALLLTTVSCDKEIIPVTKAKSTDLVVPAEFSWKTSQDIDIQVKGLALPVDFYSTLQILDKEGTRLYAANYNLRSNLAFKLTVPATVEELVLKMGKRTLNAKVTNGKVTFDFFQNE